MSRTLEEILNLAKITDEETPTIGEVKVFIEENRELINEVDQAIDQIDAAMPGVRSLDAADDELDELAQFAKNKAEDMIDLGMNVDPRFSGVILQTASNMLGHAITAKTAKIDRKLRTLQLQLQKAKLDHQINRDAGRETAKSDTPVDGQGIILDRNELLRQILNNNTSQK